MHLPYVDFVEGWLGREFPLQLIHSHRKLYGIFGDLADDASLHLQKLADAYPRAFQLKPGLLNIAEILQDGGTPFLVRGLSVTKVVTPDQANDCLPRLRQAQACDLYRLTLRGHAIGTNSCLQADFLEHATELPLHMLEQALCQRYAMVAPKGVAILAAKTVRQMLLFECWDKIHGLNHPLALAAQDLRNIGAIPLWIECRGTATVLASKPD